MIATLKALDGPARLILGIFVVVTAVALVLTLYLIVSAGPRHQAREEKRAREQVEQARKADGTMAAERGVNDTQISKQQKEASDAIHQSPDGRPSPSSRSYACVVMRQQRAEADIPRACRAGG